MDRTGAFWTGPDELHGIVAGKALNRPRVVDWRPMRDLVLVFTLATSAPLGLVALGFGAAPVAAWGLLAVAAGAALFAVRVLRREDGLLPAGRLRVPGTSPVSQFLQRVGLSRQRPSRSHVAGRCQRDSIPGRPAGRLPGR